jgi:hypothetical protein
MIKITYEKHRICAVRKSRGDRVFLTHRPDPSQLKSFLHEVAPEDLAVDVALLGGWKESREEKGEKGKER